MLPGVKIFELNKNIDERGSFTEIFRNDWVKQILDENEIVQANISISYPGVIRAWHRHQRGQIDFFLTVDGSIKLCAYDEELHELDQIVSSGEQFQLVRIPGHYWHGFKNVGDRTCTVVYFVNRLYDYKIPDEERRPWNDPHIVDKITNKPFDWNKPPYR
jgi:dTDP-4-dehydrorhamnose 3,5-epimerase